MTPAPGPAVRPPDLPTVVAAPDKFRGSATAAEVCRAIARGAARAGWSTIGVPLSDGGDGLLDVLAGAGGDAGEASWRSARVADPLGRPVDAAWLHMGGVAVVEMARASGLAVVGGAAGNDALAASTRGTGELVVAAARELSARPSGTGGAGDRSPSSLPPGTVVVGLGGSATTDGGSGLVAAIEGAGGLGGVALVGAYDVEVPFLDAAPVFAPQKGADPGEVAALSRRLAEVAVRFEAHYGVDVRQVAGGGAAGGTGGAIVALGGRLRPGYRVVADLVGLPGALDRAHLVVTGEGALDDTSFAGKVTGSVLRDAGARDLPVLVVAGRAEDRAARRAEVAGARVVSLVDRFGEERALGDASSCIARVVADQLGSFPWG